VDGGWWIVDSAFGHFAIRRLPIGIRHSAIRDPPSAIRGLCDLRYARCKMRDRHPGVMRDDTMTMEGGWLMVMAKATHNTQPHENQGAGCCCCMLHVLRDLTLVVVISIAIAIVYCYWLLYIGLVCNLRVYCTQRTAPDSAALTDLNRAGLLVSKSNDNPPLDHLLDGAVAT
jgi:hypothetical protein